MCDWIVFWSLRTRWRWDFFPCNLRLSSSSFALLVSFYFPADCTSRSGLLQHSILYFSSLLLYSYQALVWELFGIWRFFFPQNLPGSTVLWSGITCLLHVIGFSLKRTITYKMRKISRGKKKTKNTIKSNLSKLCSLKKKKPNQQLNHHSARWAETECFTAASTGGR